MWCEINPKTIKICVWFLVTKNYFEHDYVKVDFD